MLPCHDTMSCNHVMLPCHVTMHVTMLVVMVTTGVTMVVEQYGYHVCVTMETLQQRDRLH